VHAAQIVIKFTNDVHGETEYQCGAGDFSPVIRGFCGFQQAG